MDITKQYLEEIYLKNTNEKAAKILKICPSTLNKYLKKAGIKFKGQGKGKKGKLKIV